MGKVAEVKFLRKGLQNPIYGLILNDEEVIGQCPAKNFEEAVKFFKENRKQELLDNGCTFIVVEGTKISLD